MGRYPTPKEATQLSIRETAPVWLPLQQGMDVFTPDICERLKHTRNESSYFFSFEKFVGNYQHYYYLTLPCIQRCLIYYVLFQQKKLYDEFYSNWLESGYIGINLDN